MFRRLGSMGRVALTVFGLASYTLAEGSSIPEIAYEINKGDLLDGASYIANFECLAFGENWLKQQVCLYYKASVSELQTSDKTAKEICFKDTMTVSKRRDFQAETDLRIKYETTPIENEINGYLKGATSFAHIISNEPVPPSDKWHETTLVALYDCDAPLDASADTSEPETKAEPETPSFADQNIWKNPPLAADQTLPHGLQLLPGHALITHPDQSETHDPRESFVIKVPSTSAHQSWWSDQYTEQLKRLGWSAVAMQPLKILNRQNGACREQMILISLDPNSHNSPMLKDSDLPELEYSAVAFSYKSSGTCEMGE